jgi:uncharacterized membrane protein YgcG
VSRSANVALFVIAVLAAPHGAPLAQVQVAADSLSAPQSAQQTPQQLQQIVAPIALYPDALVAQILAASTYPAQVVDADRWMQEHKGLQGDALGQAVNTQAWDPSVQALTQFPAVLANMDQNISWTSSLGEAYVNQQQDVMSAIQVMRQRAQQAGKLQTDKQEVVSTQGSTIVIEPANPEVVYVPEYDPWTIYGPPLAMYPGWVPVPGIFYDGPGFGWGLGIGIGAFAGFGWGWHNWGTDWHRHDVLFNHNRWVSHSTTFIDRRGMLNRPSTIFGRSPGVGRAPGAPSAFRGAPGADRSPTVFRQPGAGGAPGMGGNRPGIPGDRGIGQPFGGAGFGGDHQAARGFTQPMGGAGMHSSAFSGFGHGGMSAGFGAQGHSSFGGGGFHGGGGGGSHGGGGGRH